jgi:hypothetical protein
VHCRYGIASSMAGSFSGMATAVKGAAGGGSTARKRQRSWDGLGEHTYTALILRSYCAYTVYSYCAHTALILRSYCAHTALILRSYCAHTALLLSSYTIRIRSFSGPETVNWTAPEVMRISLASCEIPSARRADR